MFNVGVPFLDEDVAPGWWKEPNTAGVIEQEEVFQFPDLDVDSTLQGGSVDVGVDAEGGDGEAEMPVLVEDSSDDEGDDEVHEGGFDDWGEDDDAPVIPVREGVSLVNEDVNGGGNLSTEQPTPTEPRQSSRERRGVPPLRYIEMYLAAAVEEEVKQSPQSVQEALGGRHSEKWRAAMASEMDSLRENGVYELVDRPSGKKVVKSRWVLRVKKNELGEVEKYKARVVAKGFSQV